MVSQLSIRFSISSALNTAFGLWSLFPVYFFLGGFLTDFALLCVAHICNLVFSFLTHKYFTYNSKGKTLPQLLIFFAYQTVVFIVGTIIILAITSWFDLKLIWVQPPTVLLLTILNYFLSTRLIFHSG